MKSRKIILTILIMATVWVSCSKSGNSDEPDPNTNTTVYPKPQTADNNVAAHRGAYKEKGFPDNSMASLNEAIALRCFASECDIHITKDGKVVIYHDDTFKGLTFKDATLAELRAAGTLSNGETLPLFEDYLDAVLAAGTTKLFVDVKSVDDQYGGDACSILAGQAAAAIVHAKKAKNFVEFIVGREAVLLKCIEAARGEWACAYMNSAVTANTFYSKGYTWANLTVETWYGNQTLIQSFKNLGIRVSTYNADTEAQMSWFIAQNMYAICTNYPEKLLELERGK